MIFAYIYAAKLAILNPWCTCTARVAVVALSLCTCVCVYILVSVCLLSLQCSPQDYLKGYWGLHNQIVLVTSFIITS